MLGIDSSTQSTKVEVRRLDDGAVVATGRAPHPPTDPPVSEQEPTAWWDALRAACAELGEVRSRVAAVAVAGQQHGLVLVDEAGVPLRPAVLWNDTTSADRAGRLVASLGPERWAQACGSVPGPAFTIAKLAHLLDGEPTLADRAARVMLPHDYLTWRLSGAHVSDRGDASGTGWFDPVAGEYRADLLAVAVADPDRWRRRLPAVLESADRAGTVTATTAAELGLPEGVPVAAGTGDNMAAALGLGLRAGDVVISLGTSGTVYAVSDRPTADPSGAVAGFADASGRHLPLVCTLNATRVTDAVAGWLDTDGAGLATLALEAGPRPIEPVLVPYFDGERTPPRPEATGSVVGLRPSTTRAELARAAHDGVLCGLLDGLDALRSAGVATTGDVLLVGGGARSGAFRRRSADLLGRPVRVPATDEVVAGGAAVLAAALLDERGPDELAAAWGLGAGPSVEPDPAADPDTVRARYRAALG